MNNEVAIASSVDGAGLKHINEVLASILNRLKESSKVTNNYETLQLQKQGTALLELERRMKDVQA